MLNNRWLWLILSAAFVARLAYGLHSPAKAADGSFLDIDHYSELAGSLAAHGSLADYGGEPSAEREPGYPIFLAVLFKVFGKRYLPFLIAQAALGTAILWLVYQLGAQMFGVSVGFLAAAIGAFYPPFIYYAAQPARETFAVAIDLGSLWFLIDAVRRDDGRLFAAAGLCGAAAALTHTTYLPFGLFVATFLAFWLSGKRALIYLLCFTALYAAWPLRNYAVFHKWILGTTTAAGDHFYMFMVVPEEVGGTPKHYEILAQDATWQQGMALPAADRENFFWRAGLKKVREAPFSFARLVAWRFLCDQWRLVPRPRDYGHSYRLIWWVSLLSDGWIIPLGFLGILLSKLRRIEAVIGVAFIVSLSFTYALVLTMLRYRLASMPWLILFAAYSIVRAREAGRSA